VVVTPVSKWWMWTASDDVDARVCPSTDKARQFIDLLCVSSIFGFLDSREQIRFEMEKTMDSVLGETMLDIGSLSTLK